MARALLQDIESEKILTANELKDEALEKIKGEIATKDFVRAEIAEAKQELKLEMAEFKSSIIKWIVGVGISATLLAVSANAALIFFLIQQLTH